MDEKDAGAPNRGAPARVGRDGAVTGSGAGAGGGAPEDYDSDAASGAGGDVEPRVARRQGESADAPNHGSA